MKKLSITLLAAVLFSCSNPQPGPDKTIGGAVLGAAWGAGAGAVIGNQVGYTGEGVAIGSGFGLVGGALSGLGYDMTEDALIEQEKTLASLRVQNAANSQELQNLQAKFDYAVYSDIPLGVHQVFFDTDVSNLKSGNTANLEIIAEQLKSSPRLGTVNVVGHADDSGTNEYNKNLAEARARSVSAYLMESGVSVSQIKVSSVGTERPIASNTSSYGRQLNRRVDVYITK